MRTSRQSINGQAKTVSYGYDYAGGESTLSYPSGEEITKTVDSLERLDTYVEVLIDPNAPLQDRIFAGTFAGLIATPGGKGKKEGAQRLLSKVDDIAKSGRRLHKVKEVNNTLDRIKSGTKKISTG